MSKYKYRLIEQEEESGLKRMYSKKDLILTTKNNITADDILSILKNPEYYKGIYTIKVDSSPNIDEKQIFGDRASNPTQIKNNKTIYQENGIKLYKEIESATGKNFIKKDFIIERDENGKILFAFPKKTAYHQEIVNEFLGRKKVLNIQKPEKIDQHTLKFSPSDRSDIEKVLSNAENKNILSDKNYSIELIDKK